jgi:hypothetical protein
MPDLPSVHTSFLSQAPERYLEDQSLTSLHTMRHLSSIPIMAYMPCLGGSDVTGLLGFRRGVKDWFFAGGI